jgi:hypothetical protein
LIATFVAALMGAGVLVATWGASPAFAVACEYETGFNPQIVFPVGGDIDGSAWHNLLSFEGTVDFGDGTVIPVGVGTTIHHVFTKPGTFRVTSSGSGVGLDSAGNAVPCDLQDAVLTTVTVYRLEARIAIGGGGNDRYTFDGSDSIPEGEISEYSWDFGDGSYGSGASASHTYTSPGAFEVTLRILDSRGHVAATSESVTAGEVVALDVGDVPEEPALDPNEFVTAAGGAATAAADDESAGGSTFPVLLAALIAAVVLAGGGWLLYRLLPGRGDRPAPVPVPEPVTEPTDLPETVGDTGIVYAQEKPYVRKRTRIVTDAGDAIEYFESMDEEVRDTVARDKVADAEKREKLIEHYRTYQGLSQADAEDAADRDMAHYGSNMGMVPEVAKDVFVDAPVKAVTSKWRELGDLWNKWFPPKTPPGK